MKILVIHGPKLDRLGERDPVHYGTQTLAEINTYIEEVARGLGMSVQIHQSDDEDEIVRLIEAAAGTVDGAVINPAAFSHTSEALAKAIAGAPYPVVEVHLSNIHAREEWRRRSVTAERSAGIVAGFKSESYALGLRALKQLMEGA